MNYIGTLDNYDISRMKIPSSGVYSNIITGVKKNGYDVVIVVRPCDLGKVVLKYKAEQNALEESNAELWVDNGVRQ